MSAKVTKMVSDWNMICNDKPNVTPEPISAEGGGGKGKGLAGGEPPSHVVDEEQRAVEA